MYFVEILIWDAVPDPANFFEKKLGQKTFKATLALRRIVKDDNP